MAERRCALCGQPLPVTLTQIEIDSRFQKLATPALAEERRRLEKEFEQKLVDECERGRRLAEKNLRRDIDIANRRAESARAGVANQLKKQAAEFDRTLRSARQHAQREAESEFGGQIKAALKRADDAEVGAKKSLEKARKQIEQRLQKEMKQTIRVAAHQNENNLEKLQNDRERERLRHEAETARLQGQLDNLARKLEKQSGERLGEEGELDLIAELIRAFPKDRIERIGKGKKGADIIQHVFDGADMVGRIVYENKNVKVTGWSHKFIVQADKYCTQYETPYVMIVSRAFPRKEKDFCIVNEIPIVRPSMATALARVMREGIVAIGKLRLTGAGRDHKAQELFQYLISDKFETRFKGVANSVDTLREHQKKERNWHENAWETQSSLHDCIDKHHREISAHLATILTTRRPVAIAARG